MAPLQLSKYESSWAIIVHECQPQLGQTITNSFIKFYSEFGIILL